MNMPITCDEVPHWWELQKEHGMVVIKEPRAPHLKYTNISFSLFLSHLIILRNSFL